VFKGPAAQLELAAKASERPAIEGEIQQLHGLAKRIVLNDQFRPATHVEMEVSSNPMG